MAKESFDHLAIEKAVQKKWADAELYKTDLSNTEKDPYYLLVEFPYPSGDLHTGHWYAYAMPDIYARYLRMTGKNVLFPFGFDSFGLPAENAAIKRGLDPKKWTYDNMDSMREQVKSMGTSFDWSKEVVTSDPEYYRWTQWLFSKLYEHKLAERREAAVKWCPQDQTVLANEQVINGHCERCGHEVEEKVLTQWFLKITQYAKRLLSDLDPLPWQSEIKDAQRAWIGESEGAKLTFALQDVNYDSLEMAIEVFTTRPDTIYGATYVVLAPEHPMLELLAPAILNTPDVDAYKTATTRKTERERSENKEKTGVKLEGIHAINPATNAPIPVYIADYVLASYGTGAVMAVPAHDERDFVFAKKMDLPIVEVVQGATSESVSEKAYTGSGLLINSADFTGRNTTEVKAEIVAAIGGELVTNYRLRDWLVSRQRYWGCPIPVVYDPEGEPHLIPAEHLPWTLPTDVDFKLTGKSPLATSSELRERVEKIFGEGWTPEYDTLDTFVDSSWYFLRYVDPTDTNAFSDQKMLKHWTPVDRYSGGSEHTTMHLLYARFFHKALFDMALVPTAEPFLERFNRGLIMGPDGQKMSKSKGNVINPDELVQKYGADAVRMYLAFIGPYNEPGQYPWNLDGVEAMRRFLDRIYKLSAKISYGEVTEAFEKAIGKAAGKIAADITRFKFNTAISSLMVLVRDLESLESFPRTAYLHLLTLLAPFAPHLAEHLWQEHKGSEEVTESVHQVSWPYQHMTFEEDTATVIVQINSKKRAELTLSKETSQEETLAAALELPEVAEKVSGLEIVRVVYVPGRILNLVVTSPKSSG